MRAGSASLPNCRAELEQLRTRRACAPTLRDVHHSLGNKRITVQSPQTNQHSAPSSACGGGRRRGRTPSVSLQAAESAPIPTFPRTRGKGRNQNAAPFSAGGESESCRSAVPLSTVRRETNQSAFSPLRRIGIQPPPPLAGEGGGGGKPSPCYSKPLKAAPIPTFLRTRGKERTRAVSRRTKPALFTPSRRETGEDWGFPTDQCANAYPFRRAE